MIFFEIHEFNLIKTQNRPHYRGSDLSEFVIRFPLCIVCLSDAFN